jgi:hypothetical protein
MRALALVAMSLFAFCSPAVAWGDLGHKIVCEIAYRLAVPEARAEIRRLVRNDTEFDFFSDSCTWPDRPRTRDTEHYVNMPRDATTIASLSCPFDPCVLAAIGIDLEKLSDKSKFNMHSTWDTCLVVKAVGDDVREAATQLINAVTPVMQEEWTLGGIRDWAGESFAITRAPATRYCVQQGTSCEKPAGDVEVDAAYVDRHKEVVRRRLAQAGVRLAQLLNEALAR